jgi:OOP family OmpA-OmpF porin
MNTTILIRLAGLTVLASALSGAAQAQEANYYYFGLSAGQSHSQLNESDTTRSLFGTGSGASLTGHEQQDTAYKLFGGYQFNRMFAIEGGYFNLGKFSYGAASPTGTLRGTYEVEGLNLDLVGTVPMTESLSVFGRIGAQYANTHDSFSGTGTLTPVDRNPGKRETNLKVGVGIQYDISPSMQLRGEAERYRLNDGLDNHGDVNVFSVSLVFPIGRAASSTKMAAAPAPYVAPAPEPMPAPAPVVQAAPVVVAPAPAPAPVPARVQMSADSMFGFDRAAIGAEGKTTLDNFAKEARGVKFDSINVEGHADRLGSTAYNQKLSLERAQAVKDYLAKTPELQGANISAVGLGETKPMTKAGECVGKKSTPSLIACLQPDRRVDVELTGMR